MIHNSPALYATNVRRIALLCILILMSLSFAQIGEADPTGQLAYAVNDLTRIWGVSIGTLYATAIKDTNNLSAISLNHKGMYPAWGPNGDLLYFIQRHAGQADVYSINPDNRKIRSGLRRSLGHIGSWQSRLMVSNSLSTGGQWSNSRKIIRFGCWIPKPERWKAVTQVPHFGWPYSFWGSLGRLMENNSSFRSPDPGWLETPLYFRH